MNNLMLPRMASCCAIAMIALASCGCQSMKGPTGLASTSKPKPTANPADKEIVTYLGQKKSKPKAPDVNELRNQMANAQDSSRSKYDTYLKQGNIALANASRVRPGDQVQLMKCLDEAQKEYEKALACRPNDPDCHHRLAVVADKQGQYGLADDHYEAALKSRPRDPNLLSDYGYSFSLRGDDARAEKTLTEALAISPSHRGAMANLGAIFARQGRYEDALVMFRRGASEAEAQQFVAQLFPQRGPAADAFAQNAAPNNPQVAATPRDGGPRDARPDYSQMSPNELKDLMNQKKQDALNERRQQIIADGQRPRTDWTMDDAQRQAQAAQQQRQQYDTSRSNNQPIVIGPGSGQQPLNAAQANSGANQLPIVTPAGGPYGQQPGGNIDGFRAQPGTNPSIDVWSGNESPSTGRNQNPYGQTADASQGQSFNSQPSNSFGAPGSSRTQLAFPGVNLQPGVGTVVPASGQQFEPSASQAAAQLGMNVGPGGMFPVVTVDPNGQPGFGGPAAPGADSRFGHEFSSPPQFQRSAEEYPQNVRSMAPGDPRQGSVWGESSPSRTPTSRGGLSDFSNLDPLAPQSPTSNWSQGQGQGQDVVQASGAMMPNNASAPRFNDPMNRSQADQNSTWADKPNLNGSAPYSGAWPPGSQPGSNGQGTPNSVPMWNGGQSASRPQPKQFGTASGQSDYYPERWPGAPR